MTVDPGLQALITLIPNLGVAVIFIAVWFQERKERQELNANMLAMQTAHRAEMLKIIDKQFEIMAALQLTSIVNPARQTLVEKN